MSDELNPMLEFIDQLRKKVNGISFPFGRKVYLMTDPAIPVRRVGAFFKTQIDEFVRQFEADQKAEDEGQAASGE